MQDKLDIIFEMQKAFDQEVIDRRHLDVSDKSVWMQRKILALLTELTEVLDEVNYKWWKNPKEIDYDKVKEELIDVLHFFISMCITAGMDADEMLRCYLAKNKENYARQNGTSPKKGYEVKEKKD